MIRFEPNPKAKADLLREPQMRRVVETITADAASNAQRLAPRNTGRLAESISSTAERDGGEWVGVVYFAEWYGKLWEFGHKGRSKPFLRPGTQAAISKVGGRFSSSK